jgi:hypothetical protein
MRTVALSARHANRREISACLRAFIHVAAMAPLSLVGCPGQSSRAARDAIMLDRARSRLEAVPHELSPVATVVQVFASGGMRVDGETTPNVDDVTSRTRVARQSVPGLSGFVIAEPEVSHTLVLQILEALVAAGLKDVSYAHVRDLDTTAAPTADFGLKLAAPDLSAPSLITWKCFIPLEAHRKGIDSATVTLRVLVGPDGVARGVKILQEPGAGFGRVAAGCAARQRYRPAKGPSGTPAQAMTPVIRVHFVR